MRMEMNPKKIALSLVTLIALAAGGCADDPETDVVSLETDVVPMIQANCGGCHTRTDAPYPEAVVNDVYWETKDDVLGVVGTFIVPGDSATSGFIAILRQDTAVGAGPTLMPPPMLAPAMPAAEVDVVARWVDQGAMDN